MLNYVLGGAGLVLIGLLLYYRYVIAGLRVDAANVAPLSQALSDARTRTTALESEVTALHTNAKGLDEAEAREVLASGDPARVVGFLRRSFPDSK